jgi:MFS family permease
MSRSLVALFAATFLELAGLTLFAPLLLFTLKARGLGTAAVGGFAALQWLGLLLATPLSSGWVHALGHRCALRVSGAVPLLALAGMQFTDALPVWAGLLLVAGMASALRWVLAEATVAEQAPPHRRGRLMGLFAVMIGLTLMAGPALLSALLAAGWPATHIGWLAVALEAAGLVALLGVRSPPRVATPAAAIGLRATWRAMRAAPVVMLTGVIGGFFEAGLSAVLPLYGLTLGVGAAAAALLVSASGLGSTLLPLPVGELADRWPRQRVRQGCLLAALAAGAGLGVLPLLVDGGTAVSTAMLGGVMLLCALGGGAGAGLYTLAMVDIGHQHQGAALVNSTAVLALAYTAGGLLAPVLGGLVLQWLPPPAFGAVLAGVALLGLHPWARRRPPIDRSA